MNRKVTLLMRISILALMVSSSLGQWRDQAVAAEPQPQSICTETARIMPLGDSITLGSPSGVTDPALQTSYRKDLYYSLTASGYSVDFVGSLINGQNVVPSFDPNHEGHAGWSDTQIAQNIYNNGGENWLGDLGTNWPHVILLHIGTNYLDTNPADVENILDEIDEYETATGHPIIVVLARIIDMVPNNADLHTFNDNVQAMAEARTNDDIIIVDMEDGALLDYRLYTVGGDFFNSLHPYATGYTKMAAVWKTALDPLFLSCGENNPPVITSNPGDQSHQENTTITPLDFEATDPDTWQTISWTAPNLPSGLSINAGSGTISGTISKTAAAGSPYSTTVTAHDNGSPPASDSYSFTWTVSNPVPVATADSYNMNEDETLNMPAAGVLANDSDPDGDALSAMWVSGPSHGNLTLNPNGAFDYIPADDYFGTDSFTYKANDGTVDSNIATVSIEVMAVNDLPEITGPGDQSGYENESVSLQIEANDVDGDALSFSIIGQPPDLQIDPNTGLIAGILSYESAASSPYSVTVVVSDGQTNAETTFMWNVQNTNRAPIINAPPTLTNFEGDKVSLTISASDPDGDLNIAFSIDPAHPLPAGLGINKFSGLISGTVANSTAYQSPYTVIIVATDGTTPGRATIIWTIVARPRIYLPLITASP